MTTVGDNVYVSHFSTVLQFFRLVFSACLDSIRSTFAANVRVQFQTPCPLKHSNHIWRRFPSLVRFLPIFGDECKPVLVCWGNPPLFWKVEALVKAFHGIISSNDSNVFSCQKIYFAFEQDSWNLIFSRRSRNFCVLMLANFSIQAA